MAQLSSRHTKTLRAIFTNPTLSNIPWNDIEALFKAAGGEVTSGNGSRRRIALNGVRAVFHRPHPGKEAKKGTVESVRFFLTNADVTPSSKK